MGNTCVGTSSTKDHRFALPDLILRNTYQSQMESSQDHRRHFQSQQSLRKYSPLIRSIESMSKKQFQDKKFQIQNSTKLSLLYNYDHMRARIYTTQNTQFNSFDQSQVELSYLSCVFYYFCTNKFQLDKIFETQSINQFDLYVIRLFCNGKPHEVVIDDAVPTVRQTLKYSKLIRGKQIWPVLLEKAWCKQIGTYDDAKGLSPQDAFQEITGIPAYSYSIDYYRHAIIQILDTSLRRNQWVALIARNNLKDLQNRQVFFLQKIQNELFWIRSAYNRYNFRGHMIEDSNMVKINLQELLSHFEFYTIGYYHPGFQVRSFPHKSQKRQEKIYQLTVRKEDQINIRFQQFYEGYFSQAQKEHYDYSPVYLELYNARYQLVQSCQGCDRSTLGTHSSHFSQKIFQRLRQGKYYLKIQVDWVNEVVLNQANIVIYSKPDNVTVRPILQNVDELIVKFQRQLIARNIHASKDIIENIHVINSEKKNGVLIGIRNKGKTLQKIKIDFSKSRNIRVKYSPFEKMQTVLTLESQEEKIIQILPEQPSSFVQLNPFEVYRL